MRLFLAAVILMGSPALSAVVPSQSDIFWDSQTRHIKSELMEALQRVAAAETDCKRILPHSISLSGLRSTPEQELFFATCMQEDGRTFQIYFPLGEEGFEVIR